MAVLGILLTPALPPNIEAEEPPIKHRYEIVSGELVDQPVQHIKLTEPSSTEGCNCVTYVRNRVDGLPQMAAIFPNSEPVIGGVTIEFFNGVKHIAVITKVEVSGVWVEEANYNHCKTGERFIPFDKYSLVGFWSPYGTI